VATSLTLKISWITNRKSKTAPTNGRDRISSRNLPKRRDFDFEICSFDTRKNVVVHA
jgi:hypothetical protein